MKFERHFQQSQDPEWIPDYLDYRTIKTLLKAVSTRAQEQGPHRLGELIQEVLDVLKKGIGQVEKQYLARLISIQHKQKTLFERHGVQESFFAQDVFPDIPHLKGLATSLLELSRDFDRLHRFAELNRNAAQRLIDKISASQSSARSDTDLLFRTLQESKFVNQVDSYSHLMRLKRAASDLTCNNVDNKPLEAIFRNTGDNIYEPTCHIVEINIGLMKGINAQLDELNDYVNYIGRGNDEATFHATTRVDQCGSWKESLLYTASRLGHESLVTMLLSSDLKDKIDMNVRENVRGWTPLIVASVEGHLSIVELLIAAGADQLKLDRFGWSAKEHAAFRGNLRLAALLQTPDNSNPLTPHCVASTIDSIPVLKAASFKDESRSNNCNASHILVTLGSPNIRENVNAVDLLTRQDDIIRSMAPLASCVLKIEAVGTNVLTEASMKFQLPILEDMINRPWHFIAEDPEQVRLVFTVIQPSAGDASDEVTVGSGVALLRNLRHGLASSREGLARYYTVPILAKKDLEYMGTVTFGLVVVTHAPRAPSIPSSAKRGFWNGKSTEVVGHRGSGANSAANTNLQLGENTIQSFTSAAALGASAVEFDVQLTKDLVPVIYHDFLVMEAGGDNPIYTLRLNQFVHLSEAQQTKGDLSAMAEKRYMQRTRDAKAPPVKQRSLSLSTYDNSPTTSLIDRMKHTEAAMEGAHKGNLTGDSIHGVFPTFEDLFINLPESVAFNVEMKYPMLWEAEDRNMDRYAPETNTYVNIVLEIIYRLGGNRSITFSSFSPEVCILLSLKQQDYPVLFLSKAGSVPVGDVRCSGLQQSIHFAKRWNLAGIVILSHPLAWCPRLIGYAKSAGLKVCSYGPLNNDPESAKIQAEAGLDVIIVDKVRLISETLKGVR